MWFPEYATAVYATGLKRSTKNPTQNYLDPGPSKIKIEVNDVVAVLQDPSLLNGCKHRADALSTTMMISPYE